MPNSLAILEQLRSEILQQISRLGDLRSGSITSISGPCGKANCHCHQPGHPGHGPNFRLTRKIKGKTVTENVLRWRPLSRRRNARPPSTIGFESSAAICWKSMRRSVNGDRSRGGHRPGKKRAAAIQNEVAQEVDLLLRVIFTGLRKTDRLDLEAVELAMRTAMHRAGASVLSKLLTESGPVEPAIPCACGYRAQYHDRRPQKLLTALGKVQFERAYYLGSRCHEGQNPRDRELDVAGTGYWPGVRRMMAVVGSDTYFNQGREQLHRLAGLEVTRKAVERQAESNGADVSARDQVEIQRAEQLDLPGIGGSDIPVLYIEMDGTGVPVAAAETERRWQKWRASAYSRGQARLRVLANELGGKRPAYARPGLHHLHRRD